MIKKPLVSVIIPSYNEEKNIEDCIKSMLDQSYKNLELILVDDGSTDKTKEIIKKFPVTLLEQKHQGPGNARNYGAREAKGEILVFMDADMTFSKDFLEDLMSPLIKGEYKGTFSKEEYVSNWENVWARSWNINQNWPKGKMIPEDYPDEGQDFRAILKSEFLRVGGFNSTGYTDTWTLSQKLGYKPHSVKGAKYFHENPDNLREVFLQAKWSSKREYKLGFLGRIIALVRFSFPISLIKGIYKSLKFHEPLFIIFKVVYDLGAFFGILEMKEGNLAK